MAELVHVEGLSKLSDTLKEFPSKLRKKILSGAVASAAQVIRDEARQLAPQYHGEVGEGHPPPGTLKKSIIAFAVPEEFTDQKVVYHIKPRTGTKSVTRRQSAGRAFDPTTGKKSMIRYSVVDKETQYGAYYWWWVEFGTSKMAARPYMREAFRNKSREAIDAAARALRDQMPKVLS